MQAIQSRSTDQHRWLVMLDAAAYVPTQPLDLSKVPVDFVDLSFYKWVQRGWRWTLEQLCTIWGCTRVHERVVKVSVDVGWFPPYFWVARWWARGASLLETSCSSGESIRAVLGCGGVEGSLIGRKRQWGPSVSWVGLGWLSLASVGNACHWQRRSSGLCIQRVLSFSFEQDELRSRCETRDALVPLLSPCSFPAVGKASLLGALRTARILFPLS